MSAKVATQRRRNESLPFGGGVVLCVSGVFTRAGHSRASSSRVQEECKQIPKLLFYSLEGGKLKILCKYTRWLWHEQYVS